MKKGNLLFNILIIISIIVLYFLHFNSVSETTIVEKETLTPKVVSDSSLEIVYVDLEKLLIDYKFSEQLNIDYIKRKGSLQDQLDQQVRQYEKEAIAFQDKLNRGNFLSQQSAENQQKALLKKQQELQELQYELEEKLLIEQQNMNTQLYDSVINFLTELNKEQQYNFILSKIDGSNLLVADPTLDITEHVISSLNNRYIVESEDEE